MSLHKLTAGSGYTYLTRQVAAHDVTERGHSSLASYYAEKGESPGVWVGSGLAGLAENLGDVEGLVLGDVVTQEQMLHLFGSGRHPLADQIRAAAIARGMDPVAAERETHLGRLYPVYVNDIPEFRRRVAQRMLAINEEQGLDPTAPGDPQVRARVRTAVAVELFTEEHGRAPVDAREIVGAIAKHSRPQSTAVAGFDMTFSPVKSVSTLWAIAPVPVAAAIERAHRLAVQDALTFLEKTALYTREGAKGVRQVETRGLIAAAFTHRDSRAGDPDLHTHVAVVNKVQARESGKWLAIDGRVLYKANVAASETYNTALEHHLRAALGVRFEARPDTTPGIGIGPGGRVVREIVGVDPALNGRWSSRRADITARTDALSRAFLADHGRPPTPIEAIQLAQQATLETRAKKHEPRSLDAQRAVWAEQASEVLGGPAAVQAMTVAVVRHGWDRGVRVDSDWINATAARIRDILQTRRSHWQVWHVRAEALRQVRGTDLDTTAIDTVVDLLTDQVLTTYSVPLGRPMNPDDDARARLLPAVLRRSDGSSVYTLAGATRYTSDRIVAAEARIVAHAGHHDGHQVPANVVDLAMLACAANGLPLNAGQAALVRDMATSGARVQLAIAPAGAGKTTAMNALTHAWTEDGGTVIGLAPSAAAADVLGTSIGSHSDTLAKLAWHIEHPALGDLPDWAKDIDARTLVIIDEAGMADTLTLDTVIEHITGRGGSIRLIGDDQQLAAVGAGGILRDIQASHGALHLSELMRFTNPAEGNASLALREGLPEAIGFYLDHHRVHVGDQATLTDDILTAWATDRAAGRDSVMLAPTRDLVTELNMRARTHRLTTTPDNDRTATHDRARAVVLADGNQASAGDVVITRSNDRRLRTSGTDWVKNGDRWHIDDVNADGSVGVRHARTGRRITLPAQYVSVSVELGYACTIHTAQGVTAEVSHTLLTGAEARQVAYTAITRGRTANHMYVQVAGDGDPHSVIRPEHTHPATPAGILEQILARDDAARSASTLAREAADPAVRLGEAVAQYVDSLHVAAQHHLEPEVLARLDEHADQVLTGVTAATAWEALRAHLILHAVETGTDPLHALHTAATVREVDTAGDVAAVIDWRLDSTGHRSAGTGPLPWLPGIPDPIANDPGWGPYLASLAASVRALRDQVTHDTTGSGAPLPAWARQGQALPGPDLLADIAIFRAATGVDPADRRPFGPAQFAKAARIWQNHLTHRLAHHHAPAVAEWSETFAHILTHPHSDPFTPVLAERLAAISRAGLHSPSLLQTALDEGALPDEQQAAALWWRISARLSPAVATSINTSHQLTTTWSDRLPDLIGNDHADTLRGSPWWPALVTVIDHALARGNTLDNLLANLPDDGTDIDPCQGLLWRINTLTTPPDPDTNAHPAPDTDAETTGEQDEANPFWDDTPDPTTWMPTDTEWAAVPVAEEPHYGELNPHPDESTDGISVDDVEATIIRAALARQYAGLLDPSDREVETAVRRAYEADTAPVTPERIAEVNQLAADYYTSAFPGSWAQAYLSERLRVDITDHPCIRPGYAPAGWTNLITHLRRHGVSDLELTESGLATLTRHGRLIDRFRDRLILPITDTGPTRQAQVLGFVARANPHLDPRAAGPKYLNTPDTVLFHKGAQLFTTTPTPTVPGTVPVLVEGPMDAIAITIATNGGYLGVAPLGTSLTEEQARELAPTATGTRRDPIVAFDADDAGQRATKRSYWLLTQHGSNPQMVPLRPGTDPAEILTLHGAQALHDLLDQPAPLSQAMLRNVLAEHDGGHQIARRAIDIITAADPGTWEDSLALLTQHTGLPVATARRLLAEQLQQRQRDPRAHADKAAAQAAGRPARPVEVTPARSERIHAEPHTTPSQPEPPRAPRQHRR